MKALFNILTITLSTLSIATISLASCSTQASDGYVAVPKQYLNIDGATLIGLTDEATYQGIPDQYKKITVPKDITVTTKFNASTEQITPGYKNIVKIDYEPDSKWESIGVDASQGCFSSLPALTTIVLPPKLKTIGRHAILNCDKVNTIDISNVEDIDCLIPESKDNTWIMFTNGAMPNGALIIKHSQLDKVSDIKTQNVGLANFKIKEK